MTAQDSRPWWRDRVDAIERQVACGQVSAMQCFAKMQELLNAQPVVPTPLSDEVVVGIGCSKAHLFQEGQMRFALEFARAIEAAHGITQEKKG